MRTNRLNRSLIRAVAVIIALSSAAALTTLPAQAQYVAVYASDSTLQNIAKSHTVLAIEGEDRNYGAAREYSSNGYTEWVIENHHPNGHTIREYRSPGRCLDSNGAGDAYGIPCNGGGYQKWHFNYRGKKRDAYYQRSWDVYEIINTVTGRCLDANGAKGYTSGCNGGDYQLWFMIDIAN
jgi:hypothetical protein